MTIEEKNGSSSSALSSELENKKQEIEIEPISEIQAKAIFKSMEGLIFKVHNAFFKVTYINYGRGRFTAQLLNEKK